MNGDSGDKRIETKNQPPAEGRPVVFMAELYAGFGSDRSCGSETWASRTQVANEPAEEVDQANAALVANFQSILPAFELVLPSSSPIRQSIAHDTK